jgi:hypothetical protein
MLALVAHMEMRITPDLFPPLRGGSARGGNPGGAYYEIFPVDWGHSHENGHNAGRPQIYRMKIAVGIFILTTVLTVDFFKRVTSYEMMGVHPQTPLCEDDPQTPRGGSLYYG